MTLAEVQGFATYLASIGLSVGTQRTILTRVKSLLSFGNKIGVLPTNAGLLVTSPKPVDTLSMGILSEVKSRR